MPGGDDIALERLNFNFSTTFMHFTPYLQDKALRGVKFDCQHKLDVFSY